MKDIDLQAERAAFESWFEPYWNGPQSDLAAWAGWKARAAVEDDRAQRVPDDIVAYVKGIYEFLESVTPAGYAEEAFRLPTSPTRNQTALFDSLPNYTPRGLPPQTGQVGGGKDGGAEAVGLDALLASTPAPAQQEPNWWRKRADEIELAVARSGSTDAMRCYTNMRALLQAATAAPAPAQHEPSDENNALDLLAILFDSYENGAQCYEDPDGQSVYLGNAVRLDDKTFHACADLLNRRRPVVTQAAQHQEPPQQERKPMTYREIADATSEWAHVRSDYTIGIIRAVERHHGIKE